MRPLLQLVVAGCAATTTPPVVGPAPPVVGPATPIATKTCDDAAIGFAAATIAMHSPDVSLIEPVRTLCTSDNWPAAAIACFSEMGADDLVRCAKQLGDRGRDTLYRELSGTGDEATVEVTRARLAKVEVGVVECDQFVAEVSVVLTCDLLPIDQRVSLGNQTVELWDLPRKRLTGDVYSRMARACGDSLAGLKQAATTAGCMP